MEYSLVSLQVEQLQKGELPQHLFDSSYSWLDRDFSCSHLFTIELNYMQVAKTTNGALNIIPSQPNNLFKSMQMMSNLSAPTVLEI